MAPITRYAVLLLVFLGIATGYGYFQYHTLANLEKRIAQIEGFIEHAQVELSRLTGSYAALEQKPLETVRREIIREKSQEQLLTEAVANVTPSVVSIVVNKDVPLLEVEYINPFGEDPFFRDFDFRIPVYRQKGTQEQKVGAGTGFMVTADGYIVTNRHVVADTSARYVALLSDGKTIDADVVYRDQNMDIAILKIGGSGYTPAELGDSSSLRLGQSVFAVGNVLGEYSNSVSVGIISGLNRTIEASGTSGTETLANVIQTDAAINPGNSGGPLATLEGRVVGVNVATVIGSQNIGFALPIDEVKEIIKNRLGRTL